jgi:hypothetical protein
MSYPRGHKDQSKKWWATRADALALNSRWNVEDRRTIVEQLDRLGADGYWLVPSRSYVTVFADDKPVMEIRRGMLLFPDEYAPEGARSISWGSGWLKRALDLSNHAPHAVAKSTPDEPVRDVCPDCFTQRAVNGMCLCA